MSRRFLDDVRADLNALMVTAGGVTAPALNGLLIDTIDSSIQDEALISSNAASLAQAVGIAWTQVDGLVYDVQTGGDGDFLIVDQAAGTIKTSSTPGFTYRALGLVSFTDLGANVVIEFSILKNGVQAGFIGSMTGGGNGRPRSATFAHTVLSAAADDVFSIGIQCPGGVQDVDILSIGLQLTILPTNNA